MRWREEAGKPVRVAGAVLAGILLFVLVLALVLIVVPRPFAFIPRIAPDTTSLPAPPVIVTHTFPFQNTSIAIAVPVNSSVYAGAKATDRKAVYIGNGSGMTAEFFRRMIEDPLQETLYHDLLAQLRAVRQARSLSDDEYLELLAVYVQSLPYSVVPDTPAKYPVETVMDGTGDCDDRSLLLAGLLSREDYPVALFLFGPEQHMAVGVGSDDFLYKSTGYSYIEATTFSFVGVPSYSMKGNGTLRSDPVVIPVSNGTNRYRSGNETAYIDNMSALSGRKAAGLSRSLREVNGSIRANRTDFSSIFRQLNRYAEIHNYVLSHKFDRPGVYAYLQREMAGESG